LKEKRDALIKQAHRAIITEELGVEDTSELLDLLKNMTRKQQETLQDKLEDPRVKFALGTYLTKKDAVLYFKEQFVKDYQSTFQFDNQNLVVDAARGSKVFGKMLEGYADKHQIKNKRLAWVTRLTQVFWGLVEVAIPDSIPNLVLNYWLQLLYLFEFLIVLFGMILVNQNIQHFGLLAFGLTVTLNGMELLVQEIMKGRHRFLYLIVAALATVAAILVLIGGAYVASLWWDSAWNLLSQFREWYMNPVPLGLNLKTLARALIVLLVLTFFIRSFTKNRRNQITQAK
jgi:hypothetical protein